jgi:RNA polymerase sigma-70 factor, ECF subfamily
LNQPSFESNPPADGPPARPAIGAAQAVSFHEIFNEYYRAVFAFFSKRGFSTEECHDLAQDTFLRVYRKLETFRNEGRFEAWLFQIAANIYRNTLRGQGALKREGQEVPLDELNEERAAGQGDRAPAWLGHDPGPLIQALEGERKRVLRDALDGLPAQMRRCVLLRIDGDLRYREIADLMRVSIDTVKAHLYQARQQLKEKLGDYFTDFDL